MPEVPYTEKILVVCSVVYSIGKRSYTTYTPDSIRENISSFMEHSRLSLDDPDFIDKSNALDFVSDLVENYFHQLHLVVTIQFKRSSE